MIDSKQFYDELYEVYNHAFPCKENCHGQTGRVALCADCFTRYLAQDPEGFSFRQLKTIRELYEVMIDRLKAELK